MFTGVSTSSGVQASLSSTSLAAVTGVTVAGTAERVVRTAVAHFADRRIARCREAPQLTLC